MNTRILATLATAGALVAAANINAQELEVSTSVGVESEYVFRGVELSSETVQASIEGSYSDLYFGVWANEALTSEYSDLSEFDFYAGWGYALNDKFTADMGATVYYYPDAEGDDDTFEAYLGLTANVALAPSFYVYYDFDLEVLTLEAAISKSYAIDEKTSIDLGASLGYADADEGGNYGYYGASADYVYSIKENMNAKIGVRVGGNDEHLGASGKDDNIWFGTSFNASF